MDVKQQKALLLSRARKKYLSSSLARELVKITGSPLNKQYALTCGCQASLYMQSPEEGGKLRSNYYCKNRWCQSCQSIKMATIINQYLPVLQDLDNDHDIYFVTLTDKAIPYDMLTNQIVTFQKRWRKISDLARKKLVDFKGLRKIECKTAKNYPQLMHLHYHILVCGKTNAEYIVQEWLRLSPTASPLAQCVKYVDNIAIAAIELVKYVAKLTTSQKDGDKPMTPRQLDTIFVALKGKRIYQTFGGLRPVPEEEFIVNEETINQARGWYDWAGQDWYHRDYGHALTGFVPDQEDAKIWRSKSISYGAVSRG